MGHVTNDKIRVTKIVIDSLAIVMSHITLMYIYSKSSRITAV